MIESLRITDLERFKDDYNDKIFITFDIDWAADDVIAYCLNLLEKNDIKATFFVTHETKMLDRMRQSPNIELGIHPNFNFLMNGDFRYGKTFTEVIAYYFKMVPEAVSARSHCLVQSSPILDAFHDLKIKYDLNLFIPRVSNINLKPFDSWQDDLIRLPHFWEDDMHLTYNDPADVNHYLDFDGLKIFDFHPIHVYLNTEDMSRYNSARSVLQNMNELKTHVNTEHFGINDFFNNLIKEISK
ncbi:MAG: polysaccharide deacetylase family protein [Flavobacteriales bacterium]|nr:polysaccharide deacetylase family protein [Flavobacteriales bacterium]